MVPFFVQFKCKLDQSYAVANALAEAEIAYYVQGVRIEITAAGIGNKPRKASFEFAPTLNTMRKKR